MDLKRDYSTRWIDFEDGVKFQLRFLHESVVERIRKECKTEHDTDMKMLDYCLVGWEGITSDGKAVKCDKKAKADLLENYPDVVSEILIFAQQWITFRPDFEAVKKKLLILNSRLISSKKKLLHWIRILIKVKVF